MPSHDVMTDRFINQVRGDEEDISSMADSSNRLKKSIVKVDTELMKLQVDSNLKRVEVIQLDADEESEDVEPE
jgi:hypothetical protein